MSFTSKVSGLTPFEDDCDVHGEVAVHAEVEPHLSVNPRHPNHLLAVWQQDRFARGGARSNVTAVSHDGGRSWRTSTLPGVSRCTGGTRYRASDPWTAIGADGTGYVASFAADDPDGTGNPLGEFDGDSVITRSITKRWPNWEFPKPIAEDEGTYWHEKAVIDTDPHASETLYAAWAKHLMPDPAHLLATADVDVAFSRSDDRGRTWSESVTLPPDLPWVNEWPWGLLTLPRTETSRHTPLLVVGGTLSTRVEGTGCLIYATRSDDGGETWGDPVVIAKPIFDGGLPPFYNYDYERVKPIRAGTAPCSSRSTVSRDGTIYVTWFERTPVGEAPGGARIMYARSEDRGATWETGVVAESTRLAFLPTIAVSGDGTVGVTYFDTAEDKIVDDDELTTNLRFASSTNDGRTWEHIPVAVDGHESFDLRTAPYASGYMLGEYNGLVGLPDGFGALVALAHPIAEDGATDIFYVRLKLKER